MSHPPCFVLKLIDREIDFYQSYLFKSKSKERVKQFIQLALLVFSQSG